MSSIEVLHLALGLCVGAAILFVCLCLLPFALPIGGVFLIAALATASVARQEY